jgi:hypothetical protein
MADKMSWKKAVFYGGAVLVLSACADATAPTSPELKKIDHSSASAKQSTTTLSPTAPSDTNKVLNCSGMLIHTGFDGALVLSCPVVMW